MPLAIRRGARHRRSRRKNGPNVPVPSAPIGILTATPSGSTLTVVFDQPVGLSGIPRYTIDGGSAVPIAAAMTSPTTMVLTYAASIEGAGNATIPYDDPAVRNKSGGFVAPTTVAW